MKGFTVLFFCCISIIGKSQHCDTIGNRVINCIDAKGLQQGLWEEYDEYWTWGSDPNYRAAGGMCGTAPLIRIKVRGHILNTGSYINGRKTGVWDYYSNGYIYSKVTYYEDGSLEEESQFNHYLLRINKDTTLAIAHNDTIRILKQDADCVFLTDNNKPFMRFQRDKLESRLELFGYGEYKRDIRLKKLE